ncbi:TIGR03546 family protein [Novipirellula artificiosorum]|uniref:DUF2062 domain-containing protein n=1 Tax=Novipirellula artificiosorum TaxID=2528016 RepID=A0A5C6D7U3_9BACT|nr:TIGR03546 family protein [Novipirellula artificiosorum]TWU32890.1 hypothetical protein Poly41_52680 [Novipirellula artificiosorum]
MIIWSIKLISNVRKAVAGRKYPHQLAWAVALGALLGIIPHGNLLALFVLIAVLSFKINHAMAGLTAIGVTFAATKLDPISHEVGQWVLTHPSGGPHLAKAWMLPLAPWTEMNNTVVMGSFLIGVAALLPIFMITYPLFRLFAPHPTDELDSPDPASQSVAVRRQKQVVAVDAAHGAVSGPHRVPQQTPSTQEADSGGDASLSGGIVETRIDVIRMKENACTESSADPQSNEFTSESATDAGSTEQQPMDEALNYLLRQLRTSQQKDAA